MPYGLCSASTDLHVVMLLFRILLAYIFFVSGTFRAGRSFCEFSDVTFNHLRELREGLEMLAEEWALVIWHVHRQRTD